MLDIKNVNVIQAGNGLALVKINRSNQPRG